MQSNPQVMRDLKVFRSSLQDAGVQLKEVLAVRVAQTFLDLTFDWLVIGVSVASVVWLHWALAPLAILVIANRQRAIGNTLHDAGHNSLHRNRAINDAIANALIAPAAFSDVAHYREQHMRHHMNLGVSATDPDYLAPPHRPTAGWVDSLLRNVLSVRQWWGSVAGHLGSGDVRWPAKLYICAWWVAACVLIGLAAGAQFLWAFVLLWMLARATAFHLITMFREMCDHYGLRPGGILSFSRDVRGDAFLFRLIHPRNNGYHLTHHLLPAVPYYRLARAQQLFAGTSVYRAQGQVCSSYFFGPACVVASWRPARAVA